MFEILDFKWVGNRLTLFNIKKKFIITLKITIGNFINLITKYKYFKKCKALYSKHTLF